LKVLLTGASGFVGSHILDALSARGIATVLLLRSTSDRQFISGALSDSPPGPASSPTNLNQPQPGASGRVQIRTGSIGEVESLNSALEDVTHVVHCAGCIKASRNPQFYEINQVGTRNVVSAANSRGGQIQRVVHISSLAVNGPATPHRPAREEDPPHPISEYGKSKLAGELEIRDHCRIPFTILRPPSVYGPRDRGFFPIFKAIRSHVLPRPSAAQALSLVYGPDLAQAVLPCLEHPAAVGKTYFVAHQEITTARLMVDEIATQVRHWAVPLPLPPPLLWPICLGQEIVSRLTGKPMQLNLQKYAELRAPGWVCDAGRITWELGVRCETGLQKGIAETLKWYQQSGWLS
jgi:nucleoside-diphosphate-sugar epimerase